MNYFTLLLCYVILSFVFFFFSSRRRHTRCLSDWSSDVCSSDLDEDRAVDADPVHGRHHLVAGDVIGPVRNSVPGPLRGVRLVRVDLRIDDRHRDAPPCQANLAIYIGVEVRRITGAAGGGNVKGAAARGPLTFTSASS